MKIEASAHGRVNLIGEHTDYNGGFVLPMALPQKTTVTLTPRQDDMVHLFSDSINRESRAQTYRLGSESPRKLWADYIAGATRLLLKDGHRLTGFEAHVQSSLPLGAGLGSSAALEIAILRALRTAYELPLTDVDIAKLGQKIENEFVGAHVGIMDQLSASLGELDHALFIDSRDLSYQRLKLPAEFSLAVINSGLSHSNAHGDYNTRRTECERACDELGVTRLIEIKSHQLEKLKTLPDVLMRRARHVITEHARVEKAAQALRDRDVAALGELFIQSHASMAADFEISTPEIDWLIKQALTEPNVHGARLTGGGFGGSIMILSRRKNVENMLLDIVARYNKKFALKATVLLPEGVQAQ